MIKKVLVLWFCCISTAIANQADLITPTLFNYYTENYPPSNYIEDGKLTGASVEILKLMWDDMGLPEQEISIIPWARGYRQTLTKPLTMLFSTAKTQEREKHFKWVGPIYTDTHVLIARQGFPHKINAIEDSFEYSVAAVRDDISELALMNTGFPTINMVKVTSLSQALKMLDSERTDLVLLTYESLAQLASQNGLDVNSFKRVWTVSVNGNYFAFNKGTPDKVIKQFQMSLDNVRDERLEVLKKYGLRP